jgi:hypothetical protein
MSRKKKPDAPLDPELYDRFLQSLELVSIDLVKLDMESLEAHPTPSQIRPRLGEGVAPEITANEAIVRMTFAVDFLATLDNQLKGKIHADYLVRFRPRAKFEAWDNSTYWRPFTETNLPWIVWPYFRELVHSIMHRMGWPPLVLPLRLEAATHPRP